MQYYEIAKVLTDRIVSELATRSPHYPTFMYFWYTINITVITVSGTRQIIYMDTPMAILQELQAT